MFRQLEEFKEAHGHCRVGQQYKHRKLGMWVDTQWRAKYKGKLVPERERRLEELGFFCRKYKDKRLEAWEEMCRRLRS